jgi:ABC-2 type transport system permease protein
MTALAIAKASLLRIGRDRTALFFLIALPIFVIIVIGATVRGFSTFPVGVVDLGAGRSGQDLITAMRTSGDLRLHQYNSIGSATKAVARGGVAVAVILPNAMDANLSAGRPVHIDVLAEQTNSTQQAAYSAVRGVVASQAGRVQAALFATTQHTGTFAQNLARAASLQAHIPLVDVRAVQVDSRASTLPEGFSYSAPTMLVLFMFINALAGAANIVETRRLGIYERVSAAPVRPGSIIAGEVIGLLALALLQAVLIVTIGALAFGVSWGNPPAAIVLIAIWALVGAAVGILAGTLFRSPEQASVLGPTLGIVLGMLGGCMWPLSIVSPVIRSIGHATPHAWAVDAWTALIARGATLPGIATDLAALAAFAAALMILATLRLRRRLG